MLISGILAMAALYIVVVAIATLIPFAIGGLILWVTFVAIHRWLLGKDMSLIETNKEDHLNIPK